MHQIAEFIAVLACALFTGASVYINLVEHPARMECGVEIAATEFSPSYRPATVMQATLAAVGLVSSIAAWLAGTTFWWLVAGAILGSVIPFTLFVILPTNKLLLRPTLDKRCNKALPETEPEAREFAVFSRHFPGWVRTRRAPSQNAQQQQDKHKHGQRGFHRNSSCPYASTRHGHEKFQKGRLPCTQELQDATAHRNKSSAFRCFALRHEDHAIFPIEIFDAHAVEFPLVSHPRVPHQDHDVKKEYIRNW